MAFPFDAVIFDLDGTLVATDRFWVTAARTGCRRAFRELGIERELPSARDWMSLVGHPLPVALPGLFPDLAPEATARVLELCLEEEERLLSAGGAAPMPGARELLAELSGAGVRLGVASNCGQGYLDHMLDGLGLRSFVAEPRCLDSPGIASKTDMIADLLTTFATRSAVMVGDRVGDRDAAWGNGIAHVHCAFGFASAGEGVECEAVIQDLGELPGRLARRAVWIEEALEATGILGLVNRGERAPALGITGRTGSGKTLFARDAARVFRGHGLTCEVVEAAEGVDLDALLEGPRAAADVVLVAGCGLLDPGARPRLERVLHLAVPDEVLTRRAQGRFAPGDDPQALVALLGRGLPAQAAQEERYPPAEHADWVLAAGNVLGTP